MSADVFPTIFAEVRYRDARAAMALLTAAFGFEERLVVPDDEGGVIHAELTFGNGLVMLGSVMDDDAALGGSALCIVVADPDAHHDRAVRAGAEVIRPVEDTSYGARGYTARDHEGNLWLFSTYQPFATDSSSNS
jgi:uncharacterized glyoxalase superfamily protein PhnB